MSQILKQADKDFYNQHVKDSHGNGKQLTWTDEDFQHRGRKSKKKSNENLKEKKNPQKNKNKQKHVISKMKTSFKGLTSKLVSKK